MGWEPELENLIIIYVFNPVYLFHPLPTGNPGTWIFTLFSSRIEIFCFSPSLSWGFSEDGVGWCRSLCGTESTLSWPEIWPARTFSNPEKFLRETSCICGGDPGRVRRGDFFTFWESSGRRKNGIGSLSFSSSVNDPKNKHKNT